MTAPNRGTDGKFSRPNIGPATAGGEAGDGATPPPASLQSAEITPSEPLQQAETVAPTGDAPWGRKKDGTPRAKPGARSGVKRAWIENPDAPGLRVGASVLAAKDRDTQFRQTADMLVSLTTGTAVSFLGDDWKTEGGEEKFLKNATYEYLKAKQIPDLPPGWVLLGAVAMYALPRVMKPAFQEKINALVQRFK